MSERVDELPLAAALSHMLGSVHGVEPLAQGTTGESFLVTAATGRFVAKVFARSAMALLGPAEQFALLQRIAPERIAPAAIGFDADARMLVTEFVPEAATPSSASALRAPAGVTAVAALVRRLHSLDVPDLPAFDPAADAERYVRLAGGVEALSSTDQARFDELLEQAGSLPNDGNVLCHNDLTADNIVLGPRPLLIDFDYACGAPPILDLASVTVMNEFDQASSAALLQAYFAGAEPFSSDEFVRVQRLIRLLAHFWALAQVAKAAAEESGQSAAVEYYRIDND